MKDHFSARTRPGGGISPLLGDLPDCFFFEFWRVSLLAHWAPQEASIVASEVSTVLGYVHRSFGRRSVMASRRKFSYEYKREAVRLATQPGVTKSQVAADQLP